MKGKKLPSLNGLRALSITLVILEHLKVMNGIFGSYPNKSAWRPLIEFVSDGQMGVNIFFIISGFLITTLLMQEEQKTGSISLKGFYTRRVLRIFPAYFFLLLVYFVLQSWGYLYIPPNSWATSLTFTKYFNWQNNDWYTCHAWSLSIEEHFYLLWPLLFLTGKKYRKGIAFFFIFFSPLFRVYSMIHPATWNNGLTFGARADALATGCLFALYKDQIVALLQKYWRPVAISSFLIIFLIHDLALLSEKTHIPLRYLLLVHDTTANVLTAILMMYVVYGPHGIVYKLLNTRILNFIGLLSYSLYLWQQFYIYDKGGWVTGLPQNLVFLACTALFSYYIIERPFLKLKDRFHKRAKPAAAPPVAVGIQ